MLQEYDFTSMVRGKYAGRIAKRPRVYLVPDKQKAADGASVSRAVRTKLREIREKVSELERLLAKDE
jgi:hypothetical protein